MSNQIDSYQRAIGIIADHRFEENAREILIEIIKSNPQIVVTVAEKLWNPHPDPIPVGKLWNGTSEPMCVWTHTPGDVENILHGIREKGWSKIDAIKADRTRTGRGLKEAKDFVELVIQNYGLNPYRRG